MEMHSLASFMAINKSAIKMPNAKERCAYFTGQIISEGKLTIPRFDSSFLMGDCVFDQARTFNRKPFKLDEHLRRLFDSLSATRMECGLSFEELKEVSLSVLGANLPLLHENDDYSILVDVTRGEFPLIRHAKSPANVLICCLPVSDLLRKWAKYYSVGTHAVTPPTRHVPPQCLNPRVKHRSRLHFVLADKEAKLVDPEAFCLMLDLNGQIAEMMGANFFIVKNSKIRTPKAGNILMGITRATVLELAAEIGVSVQECDVEPYDVLTADEAFQTSTPYCVFPVTKFNGSPVGSGIPGPITLGLTDHFKKRVQFDFVEQAREFMKEMDSVIITQEKH